MNSNYVGAMQLISVEGPFLDVFQEIKIQKPVTSFMMSTNRAIFNRAWITSLLPIKSIHFVGLIKAFTHTHTHKVCTHCLTDFDETLYKVLTWCTYYHVFHLHLILMVCITASYLRITLCKGPNTFLVVSC